MAGKRRHRKRKQISAVHRPLRLRRLSLELLEDRRVLAAGTATFFQGPAFGTFQADSIALGHFDGDADLDAFVVSGSFGQVWKNDGHGSFTAGWSGSLATGGGRDPVQTFRFKTVDLDGDGDLDLFASNTFANTVWFNDGSGNFSDSGQRLGSTASPGLDLGDLDGDGDIDALVGYTASAARVWLNNGAGVFTAAAGSLAGNGARGIALGDVDNDGDLDAVLAYTNSVSRTWINNGAGLFLGRTILRRRRQSRRRVSRLG